LHRSEESVAVSRPVASLRWPDQQRSVAPDQIIVQHSITNAAGTVRFPAQSGLDLTVAIRGGSRMDDTRRSTMGQHGSSAVVRGPADALLALETAISVLRARVEEAEKRADTAEAKLQTVRSRAERAETERDAANRRAGALKAQLDATQLELAGLRTLTELQYPTQDSDDTGVARKDRGRPAWRSMTVLAVLIVLAMIMLLVFLR
jgi:hypothetical protein